MTANNGIRNIVDGVTQEGGSSGAVKGGLTGATAGAFLGAMMGLAAGPAGAAAGATVGALWQGARGAERGSRPLHDRDDADW